MNMFELYEYITETFKPNEPILLSDLNVQVSKSALRRYLQQLCEIGKIKQFDRGSLLPS